jgi:short subunit dehydrogenase-like uncharacterized protein
VDASKTWMIYGANGYTGQLIAEEAAARGQRPILAGRNAKVEQLAAELKCSSRVFALDRASEIAKNLAGVSAVLHCAGPFSATARPMMDGCIAAGASYLDITGEIEVIEAAQAKDAQARTAGVSLMPAVGFDVVPSDCLAKQLAEKLPGATHLTLAFEGIGGLSPGTAKTMLENLPRSGCVRKNGQLIEVPAAGKTRTLPFRHGNLQATLIPWGDLASAYYSTGIPNIETYIAMSPEQARLSRRAQWLLPLVKIGFFQRMFKAWIDKNIRGPSKAQREESHGSFWGEVRDDQGNAASATLITPSGYQLTMLTALACLEQVLAGRAPAGFSTPAMAFGKDFILSVPGTDLQWVPGK